MSDALERQRAECRAAVASATREMRAMEAEAAKRDQMRAAFEADAREKERRSGACDERAAAAVASSAQATAATAAMKEVTRAMQARAISAIIPHDLGRRPPRRL